MNGWYHYGKDVMKQHENKNRKSFKFEYNILSFKNYE